MSCCRVLGITRYVVEVDWEAIICTIRISESDNTRFSYYHLELQVTIRCLLIAILVDLPCLMI